MKIANSIHRAKVLLTPVGAKIRFNVSGTVKCARMKRSVASTGTFAISDVVWIHVFGSERALRTFLAGNRAVTKTVALSDLGYDSCDSVTARKAPAKRHPAARVVKV